MKKIQLSKEQLDYLIDQYVNQNVSISKLSKELKISNSSLSKILKENNILVVNKQNEVSYDLVRDIIPLYNKGISLTKISKMFKADRNGLAKKLKEVGIDVVNRHNETKFDENIFDNINTEEKAYWLGFIYADGFISSNSNEFEISLKGSDIDHLQKFNQFMNHTDPNHVKLGTVVLKGKSFSRCRWGVTNKHLWNTLNSYGCVPNKSLVLKFPNLEIFSDPILIKHFIRGYFDGDGCLIKVRRKSGIKPSSSLLGTFEFLSKVKEVLELQGFDVSKLIFHPEKPKTYELNIHAKSRYSFLDYLYKDANIYLDRKFQLYQFFNSCRPKEESLGLSESKIGGSCDVNPEVN